MAFMYFSDIEKMAKNKGWIEFHPRPAVQSLFQDYIKVFMKPAPTEHDEPMFMMVYHNDPPGGTQSSSETYIMDTLERMKRYCKIGDAPTMYVVFDGIFHIGAKYFKKYKNTVYIYHDGTYGVSSKVSSDVKEALNDYVSELQLRLNAVKCNDLYNKVDFLPHKAFLTYILIAINCIIFAVTKGNLDVTGEFGLSGDTVSRWQFYRTVSYMFVHSNIFHLIGNMIALAVIGTVIEKEVGAAKFMLIYLVSGILGGAFSTIFYTPDTFTVGASAAISGLIGANIAYAFSIPRAFRGTMIFASLVWIGIAFISGYADRSAVNNYAHALGFVAGLVAMAVVTVQISSDEKIQRGKLIDDKYECIKKGYNW